jgi:hypothetical protein
MVAVGVLRRCGRPPAFLDFVDASIVDVALPSILQRVPGGYLLTYGGFMLLRGRAADPLGRRRVFVAGISLIGISSLIGGLAQSEGVLIGATFAVRAAGRPAVSDIRLEDADGERRVEASGGEITAPRSLRRFRARPAAAATAAPRELMLWVHRITADHESEGLPAHAEVHLGADSRRYELELSRGRLVLPLTDPPGRWTSRSWATAPTNGRASPCPRLLGGRQSVGAMALAGAPALEIRPGRGRVAAGEAIGGRLLGFEGVVEVAFVRRERSPVREHRTKCASTVVRERHAGRYVVEVPADLPPTASGRRCAIDYSITAKEALGDGRRASAAVTLEADGRPRLRSSRGFADRILPNGPARHFHLELATADLRGAGRVSGRLHRHGRWMPGALTVEICCVETWRTAAPTLGAMPHWDREVLWSEEAAVDADPDRTWLPFGFDIPAGLPPAVEAGTLAWRYELSACRHTWLGIDEYAVLTPVLFEAG